MPEVQFEPEEWGAQMELQCDIPDNHDFFQFFISSLITRCLLQNMLLGPLEIFSEIPFPLNTHNI